MHLQRIEITGFKSFAAHTAVSLPRGTSVVVGPNGSGKSNVADAIRWVLGEQSARAVRARKPEEVIFAGSFTRQPLGMAEVALILDNADGVLPGLPYSEVRVARRLYRSGESDYLLNGSRVRLRDLTAHLLRAQLGPDSYCVIGQGAVDELILQRPDERRQAIENAADVRRHQIKLADTRRQMAATQANLLRVQDILAELAPHAKRLKLQAERAQRASAMRTELRALLGRFYQVQLTAAAHEKWAASAALQDASDALRAAEISGQEDRAVLAEVDAALANADGRLTARRLEMELLREQARVAERSLAVSKERLRSLEGQRASTQVALNEAEMRLTALSLEEARITASDRPRAGAENSDDRARSCQAEMDAAVANEQQHTRTLNEARMRDAAIMREIGRIEASLARVEERLSVAQVTGGEEQERAAVRQKRLADLRAEQAMTSDRERLLAGELAAVAEAARLAQAERATARQTLEEDTAATLQARRVVDRLSGSLKALGVDRNAAAGDTEPRWPASLAGLPVLGTADVMVRSIGPFDRLLRGYLECLIVLRTDEGARDAWRLLASGSAGDTWAVISADGLLIGPEGEVRIQPSASTEGSMVEWGPALLVAEQQLDEAEAVLSTSTEQERLAAQRLRQREDEENVTLEKLRTLRAQLAEAEREQRQVAQELSRLDGEGAREEAYERRRVDSRRSDERELALLRDTLDRQRVQRQAAVIALREVDARVAETRRAVAERRRELQSALEVQARIDAARETQLVLAARIARDAQAARRQAAETRERLSSLDAGIIRERQRRSELAQELTGRTGLSIPLAAEIARLEEERAAATARRQVLEAAVVPARVRERGAHERHEAAAVRAQRALDTLERLHTEVSHAAEELDAEGGATGAWAQQLRLIADAPDFHGHLGPSEGMDIEGARRRIAALERELRAVGSVGAGVLDEYTQIAERHAFLDQQSQDLRAAMSELVDGAQELETLLSERFAEVFSSVDRAFQDCFQVLFAGGEARLVLTAPDDLLASGIDIVARPPGKKLQGLLSLSGGERALTIVALIFGLLRVNPTPFCVLDEVDAALDESNVQRFAQLLQEFAKQIQFLVVTHNRATMEIADAMFGVSMDAQGASHMLSVQPRALAAGATANGLT